MVQAFNINGKKVFQIMPKDEKQFVVNAKETFGKGLFLVKVSGTITNHTMKLIVE
jgi:hypothetical protein